MVKFVATLKKPATMSRDEFIDWWLNTHAPLVKVAPGLRRYVVSPAVANPRHEPPFDGIAELWFDDQETARRVMNSPELAAGAEDLRVHGVETTMFLTEEHPIVG